MRKNGLKQRLFHIALATAIAVSSISVTPPVSVQVQAEKGEGTVYAKRSFDSNFDAQNAYSGDDLGCTYTKEQTTFKVWSPIAEKVILCRYEKGDGGSVIEEVAMTKGDKGVWSATITGDIVNTYYTYKVTVDGTTREAVDIYAKAAGVNGDRAMVVDLDSTDPANWDKNYQREKTKLSDIIVWEVHVRDFSIDVSSGVSEKNRGKYKAFTEDTTVNGEGKVASCVNYLKQLGVTHVQILPMYDYASVDETKVTTSLGNNYNWGYDPENYNVPEGSYSSNPYDGNVRITEMKEMIQALHDAGIKVIMDVVYNHTYDTADSNFTKIMPDYYYKINKDLSYNNQSGCGNATRSESAMYRKFMIDSLTYWAEEYNLDGFRFDLMGIHDVTTMNQIRSAMDTKFGEDTIVLYGEGWTGDGAYDGNSAHKANEARLDDGIGYFNDQIRDALKGEHKFDETIGLVQYNYVDGKLLEVGEKWPNNIYGGIMGSVGKTDGQWGMWRPFWSKSSNCSLSYVSAHDNLTLWDKLTEGFGKNYSSTDDKLLRMNKMAGSVVLTSKGGVFMQAGEEFARTKNGDENSYKSADNVNKIDWKRVESYSDIQQYYEGMIKIRKAFSGFRSITTRSGDNWNPTNNNLTWINKVQDQYPNGVFGFYETNNVPGEWSKIAVLINNATQDQTISLNESQWVIIADGKKAGLEKITETGANVTVPAKSVVVAVPKATFDACSVTENKAPVITADSTYEASVGTPLSFQVKTSDADGDTVTLSAEGVPTGATFDKATGNFNWDSPVAGTHTITFTATDGKATATKSVVITVMEKTTQLKTYVETIEKENLVEKEFTSQVWADFENALTNAKEVIANSETDESKISTAFNLLKTAYEQLSEQKVAREKLETLVTNAEAKVKTAKADATNYDAEAITDLETVLAEANTFLSSSAEAEQYESICEDLQAANDAVVSKKANPVIRVKASGWDSPAIWVWNETTSVNYTKSGAWPGDKLTTKDAEGWYVYDLPEGATGYSIIVNDGADQTGTQTADITGIKGSVDVTVTSFSGKPCTFEKVEKPVGTGEVKVSKTLLQEKLVQADEIAQNKGEYANYYEVFKEPYATAKAVNDNADATQVEVNQAVRALKKAMKSLWLISDIITPTITVTPTISPTVTVTPTETPTDIPTPTVEGTVTPTVEPTEAVTPTVTPTETVTITPTVAPTETVTITPVLTKTPVKEKVVVHYKSTSDSVTMYYQNKSDEANRNVWVEANMVSEGNNWFGYTIEASTTAKVYFVENDVQTSASMVLEGEWWYADDSWNSENPDDYLITVTPTVTVAPTETVTPTQAPTATVIPTVTVIPTTAVTEAPTATEMPTVTVTPTEAPTATEMPTVTVTPTEAPIATVTPTVTVAPTASATVAPTATITVKPIITIAPIVTATPTPVVPVTKKPEPTATVAPTEVPTNTPTPMEVKTISMKVKNQNTTEAKLNWTKVTGAEMYKVYRATSKNGTYKLVGMIGEGNTVSYTDKKLTCGKTYYYQVKAFANQSGKYVCTAKTLKVSVKVLPAKVKLSSVKAKTGKKVKISWKKLKNVTGYDVYYATSKGGKYKRLTTITKANKVSYTSKSMKSSKKYYFKVRAYKKVNGKKVYGSYSNVKSLKVK